MLLLLLFTAGSHAQVEPKLGNTRVVFQTTYGDIEFGFYPDVAPKTVAHIMKLVRLGAYNTNHFFRVDKGFVAQVADVIGGREAPMNAEQRQEGKKTIPGEFSQVKHVRGILSMGRYSDPDSAGSSFSMLLGNAPHLDGQYAIFGKVTKGDEVLAKLEELPTRREGIFVMPLQRITILSTYYYEIESCEDRVYSLKKRLMEANAVTLPVQQECSCLLGSGDRSLLFLFMSMCAFVGCSYCIFQRKKNSRERNIFPE